MFILVCGDRNWRDKNIILETLKEFPKDSTIIHGDCRGADRIGATTGVSLGMKVLAFPVSESDWKTYGGYAGPRRNKKMLNEGQPDLVLAFHSKFLQRD